MAIKGVAKNIICQQIRFVATNYSTSHQRNDLTVFFRSIVWGDYETWATTIETIASSS